MTFLTFGDFDYSRTRVIDDNWGYEWDRIVTYVKNPELFVIFDVFKALREEYFTLSNLWHTQKIVASGDHWYMTSYEMIQSSILPADRQLLVVFPLTHYRLEGVEPIRRHGQDEFLIHETTGQHFEMGETVGFATVLVRCAKNINALDWSSRISLLPVEPARAGLGVRIDAGEHTVFVAIKNDLRRDMTRDWRRPRYTYEAGKIRFGEFETDGNFLFASRAKIEERPDTARLVYAIVNLTKALSGSQILFEAKASVFGLAFDGSPASPGVGKVRYWRDELKIKEERR